MVYGDPLPHSNLLLGSQSRPVRSSEWSSPIAFGPERRIHPLAPSFQRRCAHGTRRRLPLYQGRLAIDSPPARGPTSLAQKASNIDKSCWYQAPAPSTTTALRRLLRLCTWAQLLSEQAQRLQRSFDPSEPSKHIASTDTGTVRVPSVCWDAERPTHTLLCVVHPLLCLFPHVTQSGPLQNPVVCR